MRENSFVYIAIACNAPDEHGRVHIKVGLSNNPWTRVREMQTGCPFPIKLFKTYPLPQRWLAFEIEQKFHRTNAPWKVQGEWYLSTPDNVSEEIEIHIIECCHARDWTMRDVARLCDETRIPTLLFVDTWNMLEEMAP